MFANQSLLSGALWQQTLTDDKGHVLPGDPYLLESITHAPNCICDPCEARVIEQGFLQAANEAEASVLADLPNLSQERQVLNQLPVLTTPEEIKHLIEDKQQALIREHRLERTHHFDQRVFCVRYMLERFEGVLHASLSKSLGQFNADDVAQAHVAGANVKSDDLESSANRRKRFPNVISAECRAQLGKLSQGSNDRHEVGLTGAIRSNDEQPSIVSWGIETKVRHYDIRELIGHPVRNHERLNIDPRRFDGIGVANLFYRL